MNPSLIAVTGATGYVGGRLVPRLLELGYRVRCLVRSPGKLTGRAWSSHPNVEIVRADLTNETPLAESLDGVEAAYYLVHSMMSAGGDYARHDQVLARSFAEAARTAQVSRIIYLGGLGETGPDLSEHLSSRREVEQALGSTGIPVTVLRAAMIIGSGSASFEILRYLVERLPIMVTPKWVSTPCQPIAIRNVIGYLTGVLESAATVGGVFDIGGSEIVTYRDLMREMAESLGLRRRIVIPLPILTPRLSSYWIHLVTPLSKDIAKPLAEGLRNPVVCRDRRIAELIPQPLLTVREAIDEARKRIAARDVPTSWSMAGAIPGDPDWAGGKVFRDERKLRIEAPDWAVYRAVCRVGGGHGWYAAGWLWKLRGWIDLLVGGPGLRRGRRDPETVGYGEALDFWRVVGLERDRRLALRAEMKLPGEARLEFLVNPTPRSGCELTQRALFEPRGLFGLLYWYAVAPLHHFVFGGMLRGIEREARRLAAEL
ncbi:MAG: DUF2867 domain-containing protein [Bryobacteraceae bacterium]|nr:DUF2867 domain-containing protein [Bryobacteraceae bacterium]